MIQRDIYDDLHNEIFSAEAIIVTGMRRVGKTTLLQAVYSSIETKNKIFLDLENPINRKYFEEENYDAIMANLLVLGIDSTAPSYVFLDEIQFCPVIPSIVKYLMDRYPVKFFLTGSASFYLKNLFSESLVGRKKLFELFPLSFPEFLAMKGMPLSIPASGSVSRSIYQTIEPLYQEYIWYGGFPSVVAQLTGPDKDKALDELFTSYFNKEVLILSDFKKNAVLRDLMILLMSRIGSKIDVQKLANTLGITRPTVYEFLAFLEGTYLFSLLPPFTSNVDVRIRQAAKVYCIDSGLARKIGQVQEGQLFENTIFHQLRIRDQKLSYIEKGSGTEIDFVSSGRRAYEVKTLAREQDVVRLKKLIQNFDLATGTVISRRYTSVSDSLYGFQLG